MNKIALMTPIRDVMINQKFGENQLNWYAQWGLKGHNGIDFEAKTGCPITATHAGIVTVAGKDGDGGIAIEILSETQDDGFKTIYYHLKDVLVKVGDTVQAGKLIAHADNTGKYTTGDHLHFGLKFTRDGQTVNKTNGYNGCIDPSSYFIDKDWDRSNAYKRYGRRRTWASYMFNEVPVARALTKYLKRKPTFEEINACVYGGWEREVLTNPALAYNWKYLTKTQYLNGQQPFC
jgi:murein DD-endopeptidase MepM/ murein hydrolase activator NlpD